MCRYTNSLLTLSALLVASCGGGGGGSEGVIVNPPTPTPSPNPSPSPTPTPTPSPASTSFPITSGAELNFDTRTSGVRYSSETALSSSSGPGGGATGVELRINGGLTGTVSLTGSDASGAIRTVTGATPAFSLPNNREATVSTGSTSFVFLNNLVPGQVASDPAYQFRYVSYLVFNYPISTVFPPQGYAQVSLFGFKTAKSAIPATSRTYSAIVAGIVLPSTNLVFPRLEGVATVHYDAASKTATLEVTPSVRHSDPSISFPAFTATLAVDASTGCLGYTSITGLGVQSFINGCFYGPAGEEIGLSIGLTGSPFSPTAVGVILGK